MKVYINWDEREVVTEETYKEMINDSIGSWLANNEIEDDYEFQEFATEALEHQNISIYNLLVLTELEREKLLKNLKMEYLEEKKLAIEEDFRCFWEEYEVL